MRPDLRFRTLLKLTVLALLLAQPWGCTHDLAATAPKEESRTIDRPFLWTVAKDGRTSFLLGTVHVGVKAESDLPPQVWEPFRRLKCFMMEADQEAVKPDVLMAMATLPAGEDLEKDLKPAVWEKLSARLKPQVGEPVLHRVKAWFVSILYLQTIVPKGEPMDGALLRLARASGKKIDYLEDWREAISAFASVTTKDDLEDLVQNEEQAVKEADALLDAYRSGDEANLERVMSEINARGPDAPTKTKALLQDRNVKWTPRLTETIDKQDCFVAVGAGHLVGEGNLRSLLTAKGYEVRRVSKDAQLP